MDDWQLFLLLKPLLMFAYFTLIILPLKWLIMKMIPEGRVKRLLNKRIN